MSVPILTAVGDPGLESELAAGLSRGDHGVEVVRRCVDLADLLAAATAGLARAVVLSSDLRRLDREALTRLRHANVAVVGLVTPGDEAAERRLRQLGVTEVLPHDASSSDVSAAVHNAITAVVDAAVEPPRVVMPATGSRLDVADELLAATAGSGRVIAVWGTAGAPGRSTVAVNLAAELAVLGHSVLLVDADSYGGVVGQLLGVLDEAPGVAAACRLANAGTLDVPRLADIALELRPAFRVLTGITRPDRWIELRPAALRVVIEAARSLASYIVIDCGFCLEEDEELSYDTAAPRRNGATVAALAVADQVVGVVGADPIGLARYVRALPDCRAIIGETPVLTVANRLRRGVVGAGEPRRQVVAALDRYAGIGDVCVVPDDRDALDTAIAAGRTLSEVAPASAARCGIRDLAARVAGRPGTGRSGRRRAR